MRIVWRTLPKLALPAAIGLGLAYLATSFMPRPAPNLRPPEDLRAQGQAYGEESPVRVILERNVLKLESPLFYPLGQPPAPIAAPEAPAAAPAPSAPAAPAQAAFAPADTSVAPQAPSGGYYSATAPLSGGPSVQGQTVSPSAPVAQSMPAPTAAAQQAPATPPTPATPTAQAVAKQPAPVAVAKPVAPAPRAAPRPSLEGFRLLGVIAGGAQPLAMLQVDGQSVSLHPGEQARGWTLVAVEPGHVLLQNSGEQRRLELGGANQGQARTP